MAFLLFYKILCRIFWTFLEHAHDSIWNRNSCVWNYDVDALRRDSIIKDNDITTFGFSNHFVANNKYLSFEKYCYTYSLDRLISKGCPQGSEF